MKPMTEKKRKSLFWIFKIAGILISLAFPIFAVYERFPILVNEEGILRTNVMLDMITVLWMGFIGCGIGTFLPYIANCCAEGGEDK